MASTQTSLTSRLETARRTASVDIVRGLVIVIMALDHTREFFHSAAMLFPPDDLARTWPALFLTRWITHLCAPTFMLLAGVSACLWQSRGRTTGEVSAFLLKRGVWLIFLELVVLRFAIYFSMTSGPVVMIVLWALGWSMIALAALVYLPTRVLSALSMGVIVLHNLTDRVPAAAFGSAAWVWNFLHQPGGVPMAGTFVIFAYPIVPWFAVMACGYLLGRLFTSTEPARRRRILLNLGLALTAAFIVLRAINLYGDARPWSATPAGPMLSFLNTTKYPPSLLFLLMTLGPALLLLRAFDGVQLAKWHPLVVFGRVPLFFFVVHFYLIHVLTFPFAAVRYGRVDFLWLPLPPLGGQLESYPAGFGYGLGTVYFVWLLVLVLMYPLCRYFAALKERRKSWWLVVVSVADR
jgi:uncharacterized membrane protein